MSMAGKRYYGADVPRSTGPHPDPLGEAYRAFERWCREHDPDGNMDVVNQAMAYSEWSEKNSIEKYLDAAQPVRGVP